MQCRTRRLFVYPVGSDAAEANFRDLDGLAMSGIRSLSLKKWPTWDSRRPIKTQSRQNFDGFRFSFSWADSISPEKDETNWMSSLSLKLHWNTCLTKRAAAAADGKIEPLLVTTSKAKTRGQDSNPAFSFFFCNHIESAVIIFSLQPLFGLERFQILSASEYLLTRSQSLSLSLTCSLSL